MHDQQYMDRCLELAALAAAEGESPVGSVIVKDGQIIGEAYEKSRQLKDITRHVPAGTRLISSCSCCTFFPEGAYSCCNTG